jgi:Putative lumazine-binding
MACISLMRLSFGSSNPILFANERSDVIAKETMNITTTLLAAMGIALMNSSSTAQNNPAEIEAAKLPLQNYVKAQETGNSDFIRRAFTKDAKVMGHMGGKLISWSLEEYAGRFSGRPAEDEAQRKRSIEIISLTGNAAVGKVVLDYPAVKFSDYMSLLKMDGEWKIVNKSFDAEMKTPPAK